jgi:hypothetical protein
MIIDIFSPTLVRIANALKIKGTAEPYPTNLKAWEDDRQTFSCRPMAKVGPVVFFCEKPVMLTKEKRYKQGQNLQHVTGEPYENPAHP